MRWVGFVARVGEMRKAYSILVGKPEGKSHLGRHRCRWKDNIKMDRRENCGKVCIGVIQLSRGTSGGVMWAR